MISLKKVLEEVVSLHINLIVNFVMHAYLFALMLKILYPQKALKEI
jgi:hypothetical protein